MPDCTLCHQSFNRQDALDGHLPSAHHRDPDDPSQPARMMLCDQCGHQDDAPQAWDAHERDCTADEPAFDGVKIAVEDLGKEIKIKTTEQPAIYMTALEQRAWTNWDAERSNPYSQITSVDRDSLALYGGGVGYMDHLVYKDIEQGLKIKREDIRWFRAFGNHHPERGAAKQNLLPHLLSLLFDTHLPTKHQHAAHRLWLAESVRYAALTEAEKAELIAARASRPIRGHVQYKGKHSSRTDIFDLRVAHLSENRLATLLRISPQALRTSIACSYNQTNSNNPVGRAISFLFWYHSHRFDISAADNVVTTTKHYAKYRTSVADRIGAKPCTADMVKKILLHLDEMEEAQPGSRSLLLKPSTTVAVSERDSYTRLFQDLKQRCGFLKGVFFTDLLIRARRIEEAAAVKEARDLKGLPAQIRWEGAIVRIIARVFLKYKYRPDALGQQFPGVIKAVVEAVQKKMQTLTFTEGAIRMAVKAHADKINRWIDRLQEEKDVWKKSDEAAQKSR